MKLSDDVSFRKARRKVANDGLIVTISTGSELVARKKFLYPFFRHFVDSGHPEIVSARNVCSDEAIVEAADDYNSISDQSGVYTFSIGTGYVLSETGVALTNDGAFVAESLSTPGSRQHKLAVALSRHAFFDGPRFACDLVRGQTKEVDRQAESRQAICSLIPRYQNYYHWTVETLPKLRSIREYERATNEAVSFLIPDELPAWMEEPLSYLGVNRSETISADASAYRASELVVPSFPRPTNRDCQWVRERVFESVTSKDLDVSPGSNVYISRKDTQERRVLNEDVVVNTLSKYGFESYCLADYSVAEQAVLFNEADLVIGAHGAGFSNLIYAEDTAVLELFGEKVKPNYAKLAKSIGLPYESLECQPHGVDLRVDTEQLGTVVEELLSRN